MIFSVYIEKYILDIIKCYGTIDEVVNRMLDAANGETFDVFDKPSIGTRDGSVRCNINVINTDYINLARSMPPNSPRISLRRFIHWFIEEEMPLQLGWKVVRRYKQKERDKIRAIINNVEEEMAELSRLYGELAAMDEQYSPCIQACCENIKKLREVII